MSVCGPILAGLFEIFTQPMPQGHISSSKSLQLKATHTAHVTNATIKQTMQLKIPENVTISVKAKKHFANVYRLQFPGRKSTDPLLALNVLFGQ